MGSFLEDVLAAKQRTRMIQEIPETHARGEEPEPEMEEMVEEEFDLSDILGEEVEGEAAMSKEQLAAKIERELEEEAAAAAAKAAEEEAAKAADTPKKKKKKKGEGKEGQGVRTVSAGRVRAATVRRRSSRRPPGGSLSFGRRELR